MQGIKEKSFKDVIEAIRTGRRQGLGDFNNELGAMTSNLEKVIEIDTEETPQDYRRRVFFKRLISYIISLDYDFCIR